MRNQLIKKRPTAKPAWELELLEYAKLQGTEDSKEWRKLIEFINQNRKELVESILDDIPRLISVEVGFAVTKKKLVQQLRDKYLNN